MKITVETNVAAPVADVWRAFNEPDDIFQWDAPDGWHITRASNDLKVGGKLSLRMEPKDGGKGVDIAATYTQIQPNRLIESRCDDGRNVREEFIETDSGVTVRQTFDAESIQPEGQQRSEWQAILDRFGRHVESIANS